MLFGFARVPLAGVDGAVRQRLQRHRGDEVLGRLGHHDLHRRAGLDQLARQLGGLVAGDAARQAEHDVAAREFGGRRWHGGIHGPGDYRRAPGAGLGAGLPRPRPGPARRRSGSSSALASAPSQSSSPTTTCAGWPLRPISTVLGKTRGVQSTVASPSGSSRIVRLERRALEEAPDHLGRFLVVDRSDDDALAAPPRRHRVERRHLEPARLAPGRPEVEHDDLAGEGLEAPAACRRGRRASSGGTGRPAGQARTTCAARGAPPRQRRAKRRHGAQRRPAARRVGRAERRVDCRASLHSGRSRGKVRGSAPTPLARPPPMPDSKSPRFIQTWLADAEAERDAATRRARARRRRASRRSSSTTGSARTCSRRSPSWPSTTRRAPRRRSSPRHGAEMARRDRRRHGAGRPRRRQLRQGGAPVPAARAEAATSRSTSRSSSCATRCASCSASTRSSTIVGLGQDFSTALELPAELLGGDRAGVLLSRLEHRQLHARRGARLPAPRARARRRRRPADRRRPGQAARRARGRLRRRARRHRGLQPATRCAT